MRIWSRKVAGGHGRWGIRQSWKDKRKCISSQLLKGYTQDLSNQTKVSRRAQFSEQKTCPEIQVYFLRALLTSLAQTKQIKETKSCTSFSFSRLVVTTLRDIHQTNKPGERAPIARTFCVQISTCLAFTWPIWGIQSFCPVLKSSDYPGSEEVSTSTNCMASVKKCTYLWIPQTASISRKKTQKQAVSFLSSECRYLKQASQAAHQYCLFSSSAAEGIQNE